ncbi:prolipoprotein diacylglyceryl transferase, partial [Nanoarchaeota archaeon]
MVLYFTPIKDLISIGPLTIQTWGFFVALGFLLATLLSAREAKKRGLNQDHIYNLIIWVLLFGLIGSRVFGIFLDLGAYMHNPLSILFFWQGGLVFHGGLIGGIIGGLLYVKYKKINFWKYVDVVAIFIPLGHALGRLGCFFSWDGCHGVASNLPWAVQVTTNNPSFPVHPTHLYSAIALFIFFIVLYKIKDNKELFGKKTFHGWTFSLYLIIYAVWRFLIEFIRVEPKYGPLTGAQYFSIIILIFACFIFYKHWYGFTKIKKIFKLIFKKIKKFFNLIKEKFKKKHKHN